MGTWFTQWQNRLPGWLGRRRKPCSDEDRLRRIVESALQGFTGNPPDKDTIQSVLQHDRALETWYAAAKEVDAPQRELTVEWDGLRFIEELRRRQQGYLLVFVQPYLGLVLEKLAQDPEPVAGVIFQPHEDPAAHVPVLERGHGLAFSLSFFPEHGEAALIPFFRQLTCVSTKAVDFAVLQKVPILPLWARLTGDGAFTLHLGRPLTEPTADALLLRLFQHFMGRLQEHPEQMDWTAACFHPPAKRLLTSRKAPRLVLPSGTTLAELEPFTIIVRVPDDLRQACLALPAVRALKRGRPDVTLAVLGRGDARDLWERPSVCDRFLPLEEAPPPDVGIFRLGVVLGEDESAASDLAPFSVERLAGMANHPAAASFDDLLPMPRKLGPPQHRHRRYLRPAHRLGAAVEDDPSLWAPLDVSLLTEDKLSREGLVIGLAPTSSLGRSYEWPPERFEELLLDYPNSQHIQWRLVVPHDREEAIRHWATVRDNHPELTITVDPLDETFHQGFHWLGRCRILVANDSPLLQLASIMGLGTVGIYGPGDPVLTAPVGDRARTICTHVECHPCNLPDCPLDHRCLREVATSRVIDALQSLANHLRPLRLDAEA